MVRDLRSSVHLSSEGLLQLSIMPTEGRAECTDITTALVSSWPGLVRVRGPGLCLVAVVLWCHGAVRQLLFLLMRVRKLIKAKGILIRIIADTLVLSGVNLKFLLL